MKRNQQHAALVLGYLLTALAALTVNAHDGAHASVHDTVRVTELYPAHLRTASFVAVSAEGWTAPAEFTTAPAGAAPFSFIYMGDAQNGLDRWGVLLQKAYRSRPDAAFYLLA